MDATEIHDCIRAAVIDLRDDFTRLSLDIHSHPETAFEERHASQVSGWAGEGSASRRPPGLDTAFRAVRGSGAPVVAFLAEYDALPGLGHACGHNLIRAGASTAAARSPGVCLDTPRRSRSSNAWRGGGGGNVIELEAGVFDGVDAALMFHPAEEPSLSNPAGSSDVGNVRLAVPTIHPYLQIVDRGVSNHTEAFRDAAASPRAHDASLKMIGALAQTAADLILNRVMFRDARREFETRGADTT